MGASYAKLVLGFSEPVSLEITATNPITNHSITEYRYAPRAFDTVTVQRLLPSMPSLMIAAPFPIPSIAAVPAIYQLDVKMIDIKGNTKTASTGPVLTTRDLLAQLPFPRSQVGNQGNMPPISLSRTLENLRWVGSTSGTNFQASVDTQIMYDVPELLNAYTNPPNTPNGSGHPNEKQVVVAQVLHKSGNGPWTVLPLGGGPLNVSAPADRIFNTVLTKTDLPGAQATPILHYLGHCLISSESGANGQVTFSFSLSSPLPAGDKIRLNVIAILERDYRDGVPGIDFPWNEFWASSMVNWNMPKTDPANRSIETP